LQIFAVLSKSFPGAVKPTGAPPRRRS